MKINYSALKILGLSPLAIDCYEALYATGPSPFPAIAKHLGRPESSVYRCIRQLISNGLAVKYKVDQTPTYYLALRLDEALDKHQKILQSKLTKIVSQQKKS